MGWRPWRNAAPTTTDLVILDIMMPELDGFSVCRELRKNRPVPVIILSARGEEYDRIHGFELGDRRLCGQALFAPGS